MSHEIKILFQPSGRAVYVLPGTLIMEAAARAGIILQAACGGAGTCGKCIVRVQAGVCPASETEIRVLGNVRVAAGDRLACRARIQAAMTVVVPESSLFESGLKILMTDQGTVLPVVATIRKTFRRLAAPRQGDTDSDLRRLTQGLIPGPVRLDVLRALPGTLRRANYAVTLVQADDAVIAVEAGDTSDQCYGVAFDVGSTTLVGTLVDLLTGREMGVAACVNPQTSFGDDVVSRIQLCRSDPHGLARLSDAVVAALNRLTAELLADAAVPPEHVYRVMIAGNTTMQQLVCGIDPSALGELPFVPAFNRGLDLEAAAIGLHTAPAAHVFVFPQIGGFVGGDTVAGILATGLDRCSGAALLVDIGTNGEIVLAHAGQLMATSVAAGPAFEGARIVNGMRAAAGAIEKVVLGDDGDLRINVIGDRQAAGLCGTALIDAVAELLRCGMIDATGRIVSPEELPASLSPALRMRVCAWEEGGAPAVVLAHPDETVDGRPLCLFQKDIRELQLANAAIRAGINRLLRQAGIAVRDLKEVLLAGAFGNFIRRRNALRIGMLPPLPHERIRFVGNAASLGAKLVLLSNREKQAAEAVLGKTRHVDLSLDPEFQMEFSEAMLFPEAEPEV